MITTTPHWTPSWPVNERKNWCRILSRHRHHKAQGKMGRFEKFGHYRTFTCGILVSWKTAGARAKPQPNRERPPGRENLAAFLFPHHGPGSRTAGAFLLSPCPAALYTNAAGRPKHPLPWAAHAEGRPRASLVNLPPPPLFGSFLKNKSLRGK